MRDKLRVQEIRGDLIQSECGDQGKHPGWHPGRIPEDEKGFPHEARGGYLQ